MIANKDLLELRELGFVWGKMNKQVGIEEALDFIRTTFKIHASFEWFIGNADTFEESLLWTFRVSQIGKSEAFEEYDYTGGWHDIRDCKQAALSYILTNITTLTAKEEEELPIDRRDFPPISQIP